MVIQVGLSILAGFYLMLLMDELFAWIMESQLEAPLSKHDEIEPLL